MYPNIFSARANTYLLLLFVLYTTWCRFHKTATSSAVWAMPSTITHGIPDVYAWRCVQRGVALLALAAIRLSILLPPAVDFSRTKLYAAEREFPGTWQVLLFIFFSLSLAVPSSHMIAFP
jgi:hypothetical protein